MDSFVKLIVAFFAWFKPKKYPKAVISVKLYGTPRKIMVALKRKEGKYFTIEYDKNITPLDAYDRDSIRSNIPKVLHADNLEMVDPVETELFFINNS